MFRFVRWATLAAFFVTLPVVAQAQVETDDVNLFQPVDNHWIASGFVGSSFGTDADEASATFGGSIGYLWNGSLGAEFLASFAPNFQLDAPRRALLAGEEPWVNSYMVNAIGAFPFGEEGRWRPYVSGGLGAMTLRSDALLDVDDNELDPDSTQAAGNIGAGLMGFLGNWGFRGDIRYYRGFENDEIDLGTEEGIGDSILSELEFWRAHVGLAFRW